MWWGFQWPYSPTPNRNDCVRCCLQSTPSLCSDNSLQEVNHSRLACYCAPTPPSLPEACPDSIPCNLSLSRVGIQDDDGRVTKTKSSRLTPDPEIVPEAEGDVDGDRDAATLSPRSAATAGDARPSAFEAEIPSRATKAQNESSVFVAATRVRRDFCLITSSSSDDGDGDGNADGELVQTLVRDAFPCFFLLKLALLLFMFFLEQACVLITEVKTCGIHIKFLGWLHAILLTRSSFESFSSSSYGCLICPPCRSCTVFGDVGMR